MDYFGGQGGHLDRVGNPARYVVRVRVARAAEDGREVVEVPVHGVRASLDRSPPRVGRGNEHIGERRGSAGLAYLVAPPAGPPPAHA